MGERPCTLGVGCEQAGVCYAAAHGAPEKCDARPAEPGPAARPLWYRGWECDYDPEARAWTGEGWYACLGGADLDCQVVRSVTWSGLLDEIDDQEDEK